MGIKEEVGYRVVVYDLVNRVPGGLPSKEVVAVVADYEAALDAAVEAGVRLLKNFPHGAFEIQGLYGIYKGSTSAFRFAHVDRLKLLWLLEEDKCLQFVDPKNGNKLTMEVRIFEI